MNLWIRSQDKRRLIKSNGVDLTPSGLSIFPIGATGILGTYETEERALEVLDEIHNILNPKGIIKFNSLLNQESLKKVEEYFDNQYTIFNGNMELLQQVDTYVYEMPEK